jgi:hypothetical protein
VRRFPDWPQEGHIKYAHGAFAAVGKFPIIDIKLKNNAQSAVFVKGMRFATTRREMVKDQPGGLEVSAPKLPTWEYNLLFDAQSGQQTIDLPRSQVIPANDVDRFVVVVGVRGIGEFKRIIFDCRATLFYDQDGATQLQPMTIAFTDDSGWPRGTVYWKTFTWHPEPVPIQPLEVL